MDAWEALRQAADHIERNGKLDGKWVPDEATTPDGHLRYRDCPACAGGALALVITGYADFSPNFVLRPSQKETLDEALDLLVIALDLRSDLPRGYPLDRVIEWSDTHTQDEVVVGLRKAAG